ncbi:MAG: pyridine nucleotide-disulfide oxidoreductase, partial [Burkholderiales bacterium PBB5]
MPAVPGAQVGGVLGIRTLADTEALGPRLADARQVVVIGAGFIGLEFAAVAAARGLAVQVLELGPRAMARAVSPHTSAVFEAAHRAAGVQLHLAEGVAELLGDEHGQVRAVRTASGRLLPADLVVYGIGVLPNDELARTAGLAVDNGVRVDGQLRSSDAAISAVGDLASFHSPWASAQQPWVRLESVQNAVDQAKLVAARLAGQPLPDYDALPWFWTDQGVLKLQIAGLSDPQDETVVLGDTLGSATAPAFSVLCLRGGRLAAV